MRWAKLVGANIRRLRQARGWSQEELAAEASMAMRHVGRIERADVSATLDALEKIAQALDARPSDLFDESTTLLPLP